MVLMEPQYFGSIAYFETFFHYNHIVIDDAGIYRKRSFRNRCYVAGAQGPISLSVPITGGRNFKGSMRDVQIDNSRNWSKEHWRTLYSCYGKAPYFEYYGPWLASFFSKKHHCLFDMNCEILLWALPILGFRADPPFRFYSEFKSDGLPDTFIDNRDLIVPAGYNSLAKNLVYQQVFQERCPFLNNLSIIDLLLCKGPEAFFLMKEDKNQK